jgi:fucose 4-O-acetylase-like acetyltransferase
MTRLRYIDEAKGLGILCIVFLHYEQGVLPWTVNTFIGSFMITIFYIVAGMIMAMKGHQQSTKDLVNRRLKSLGKPYLYWSIIILIFDCLLWTCGYYNTYFIARETYKTIVLRGIGTLWFLPALFFGEIGWNWIRSKKYGWWIIALVAIILYSHFYGVIFNGRNTNLWKIIEAPFFTINSAMTAILGVAAGYLIFKTFQRLKLNRLLEAIIGFLLCCAGYFTASHLQEIIGGLATDWLWGLFAPILGPTGFILLFKSIQNSRFLNYFDFWGRNSLSLMVTHYSIVQVLIVIFTTKVLNLEFYGWTTIYAFLASMPIQYALSLLLKRYAHKLIRP